MALFLPSALLIVLLFHGYHTADWTSGPQNGTTLYACVGDDVIIPWTYALSTGDVLHDIQWLYQGNSQEVIAMFSHGAFLILPAFANRVQRVTNGGLQISQVTKSDSGNYSVEMTGADASQNIFILQTQLKLEIADGLMTSSLQLHVSMNPVAVLDNATKSYVPQLLCGHFLYPHKPPFDVKWLTPSGSLHGSSHYKDGQFSLLLPPQVTGGNYSCRVSASTAGTCVARDIQASVAVDAVATTLAIMQARLDAQEAEMAAVKERIRLAVSFHSIMDQVSLTAGDHLILPNVITNQGNGYNNTTGVFTAPVSGTYCFMATTGPVNSNEWVGVSIMRDQSYVGYAGARDGQGGELATAHAVLHLHVGQTVWLRAQYSTRYWRAYFSGFLVSPDP